MQFERNDRPVEVGERKWRLRQFATGPALPVQFTSARDGSNLDLSTALAVVAHMYGPLAADTPALVLTSHPLTAVAAASGTYRLDWPAGCSDLVGVYQLEIELTLADGTKETYPQDAYGYVYVEVRSDLNGS